MEYVFESVDLTKKYSQAFALDKVNIHVPKGSIYGLVGPNGAGKSTLMRILLGSTIATEGYVAINNKTEFVELNSEREKIGSIIESPTLYPTMSAIDNLIARAKLLNLPNCKQKAMEVLTYVGLMDTGKKKVKNFSLGMKQRLAIGLALLNDPKILVLDEPTNGLDPLGINEIREMIQNLNKDGVTILISSHFLSELTKFATHYGILRSGKLIKEVSKEEILANCNTAFSIKYLDNNNFALALTLLLDKFDAQNIVVSEQDNTIKVLTQDDSKTCAMITRLMLENNIDFVSMSTEKEGYESYILSLINGKK